MLSSNLSNLLIRVNPAFPVNLISSGFSLSVSLKILTHTFDILFWYNCFGGDQMTLYELALSIAREAHKDQVDKAGADYINHPIYVASLVDTEEEKSVALLHDVIEDSDFTLTDLMDRGMPNVVVQAVSLLTKDSRLSYQEYLTRVKTNELATKVKLADLKHNSDLSRILEPSYVDYQRIEKYKKAIEFLSA